MENKSCTLENVSNLSKKMDKNTSKKMAENTSNISEDRYGKMTKNISEDTPNIKKQYDVVIIGGGTAGLFCAYEASKRGLKIALIDHNDKLGIKLSLAGGGMGNMTNRTLNAEHYVSSNPKEAKKAITCLLKNFQCQDVLDLLNLFQIPFEERDFGQIFCLNPVKKFIGCLEKACSRVDFFLGEQPQRIYYDEQNSQNENNKEKQYHIVLNNTHLFSNNLVIATGSTAYPQIGGSDFGLRLAKKWGHEVYDFSPVLAPFVIDATNTRASKFSEMSSSTRNISGQNIPAQNAPSQNILESNTSKQSIAKQNISNLKNDWNLFGLEGISVPVRMSILHGATQSEDPCGIRSMLFTHKGLSGPAVLVASCFWTEGQGVKIDFLPKYSLQEIMHDPNNGKKNVKNILLPLLPDRLVYRLIPEDLQNRKVAEIGKKDRQRLIDLVHGSICYPQKTEGLKKAEAARGGVSVENLKKSFESKFHSGLYFCGEVIDITGLLGGYNIHFALACAKRVAHSLRIH